MPVLDDPRYELFAQELAKGVAQPEAYRRAGFAGNKTAASRRAHDPVIRERVAEILAAGADRAEITREMVVRELGRIAFADIRQVFDSNGSLKRVEDLDDDAAASVAAIEVVQRRVPGGDKDETESVAKIKTWDKRAALVDIAKMQGWHVERHEHTGKDGGAIEVADKSPRDIAKDIAFLLARAAKPSAAN